MNDDDRSLATSRRLDATPAQVYAAFRDPARLCRFWGPNGFTCTFETFEFRPGGRWKFTMHGPDGSDYPNDSTFAELVEDRRIVIDASHFQLHVDLREAGGQTDLQWRQVFPDAEHRKRVEAVCIPANEQNLDRLQAELARAH